MRILQINAVYKTKSTGRIVWEMHKHFQKRGHESFVAYGTENTDISNDENVFQVGNVFDHKLHALLYRLDNMQGCHSTWATSFFLDRIKNINPDIVIAHNLHSNYLDVPLLFERLYKLKINTVVVLHDCWFFTGGCYHYIDKECNNWLTGCDYCKYFGNAALNKYLINKEIFKSKYVSIIAISKWTKKEAYRSPITNKSKISMVYNWIDLNIFCRCDSINVRNKYKINNDKYILGVSTGWSLEKGQLEMLELAKKMPEYKIVLVGNQINKVEYPSNVLRIPFTESKGELAELYSGAEVFVNLSKQETFGLVSAEALACGTPILVYDTTACPEFVEGNTGRVVKYDEDIVNVISELLDTICKIGREKIALECRTFAEKNFDMSKNIDKYINIMEKILKNNR